MKYELEISENNRQCHIDIEHDIQKQKDGLFTFIIKIASGNITDYSVVEYADIRKYLVLKKIIIQELVTSHPINSGDQSNALRPVNIKRTT